MSVDLILGEGREDQAGLVKPEEASAAVRVLAPGLFTTVQDLGRPGYRASGVPVGGACDPLALRVANLLVGNPEGAAALELTLVGPTLEFLGESVIALAGSSFEAWLDGTAVVPLRPYYAPKGAVLVLRRAAGGCRGVLALAGGVGVAAALGSRSTYVRARLGGVAGRPLGADDLLPLGPLSAQAQRLLGRLRRISGGLGPARGPFAAAAALCPALAAGPAGTSGPAGHSRQPAPVVLRAVPGREAPRFAAACVGRFWNEPYTVRPEADRMGARLSGPLLPLQDDASMVSEAVAPGAVQVPPDGQPIVLLPDCGTTGGYPRIAHVAAADLPLAGQLRPGTVLRFQLITIQEAEQLLVEREIELARFAAALRHWM